MADGGLRADTMVQALRAELFKTTHRRMTYILLAAAGTLVAVFYSLLWLRIQQGPAGRRRGFEHWLEARNGMAFVHVVPYGLELERFFVTLICVVFAATMMGNEFDWHTAGHAISRGVRRDHFIISKAVVAVLFTVVAVAVGLLVAIGLSAYWSNLYGLPFGVMDAARLWSAIAGIGRTAFVILPFVAMAMLFATIWRSAGMAVGFSLGCFFLESIFTGLLTNATGWLSHVPGWLFNTNIAAVMHLNGVVPGDSPIGSFVASSSGTSAGRGAAVLAAWMAAFAAIAFWRFIRRDIPD